MKKAVVFLADGFEEVEALTPVDYLRRAGVQVVTVAVPAAGQATADSPTGSHGIKVKADCSYAEFFEGETALPDAVYAPGGMPGSVNLGAAEKVLAFIRRCFDEGKYVAAICAAPVTVLAKTGVLKGKRWTCHPSMEEKLSEYCGSSANVAECMEDATLVHKAFVTDGTVITGRGAGAAGVLALELVRLLAGEDCAKKVQGDIVMSESV